VITSAGKSTVSLSYKPPADDGGAEITNYVIEHREEGLASWTRATKDTISKTSYTVNGLTANSVYEFRVAAENKAGVGPPSEPSQPVAAKETVCKYIGLRVCIRATRKQHAQNIITVENLVPIFLDEELMPYR